MSITYQVLGEPGRDNAVLATVNTGQSQHRLLFDCGEGCLSHVPWGDVQAIEVLFFSHFHIDHVAGFDSFFRGNFYRETPPVRIFGPPDTRRIIHHRMQGFTWNLVENMTGEVYATELTPDGNLATSRYLAREGFAHQYDLGEVPFDGIAYRGREFTVTTRAMHHGTPSMAYVVREDDRTNVDMQRLAELGLQPGPWLQYVKDLAIPAETALEVSGQEYSLGQLREKLLTHHPGDSLAYLTDFCLENEQQEDELVRLLGNCKVIICENNFRDEDAELAERSFHMTSRDVGRLAARVQPEKLILFHISDRYTPDEWHQQIREVQTQFPRVEFPPHWD